MSITSIQGSSQIRDTSITNDEIATNAGIHFTKLSANADLQLSPDGGTTKYRIKNIEEPLDDFDAVRLIDLQTASADIANKEIPSGVINGSNKIFTLSQTPSPNTENVYVNGILQFPGALYDYVISGATITFNTAPAINDFVFVDYIVFDTIIGGGGGSGLTSLNGLTGSSQTFAVSSTGTDFSISSAGSTHTFALPDAGASSRGVVSTGAQTLAGIKTFSSAPVLSSLTVSQPLKLDGSGSIVSGLID